MRQVDPALPMRHESVFRVRFDEAGPTGMARASSLLSYAVDAAWRHSEALGFPRPWYHRRGVFWFVRAVEARILGPVPDGEPMRVTTRLTGFRKVMARRESEVFDPVGALRAVVVIDWAMTDGRAPVRVPAEFERAPVDGPGPFTPIRVDLPPTPAAASNFELTPRLRDLDPMNHANNGAFVDWLDEAVASTGDAGLQAIGAVPRTYRLEYFRPVEPGAKLVATAWRDGSGWAHRLTDAAGEDSLRGRLEPNAPSGAEPSP